MESGRQQRFPTLWPILDPQPEPRSRDEILAWAAVLAASFRECPSFVLPESLSP